MANQNAPMEEVFYSIFYDILRTIGSNPNPTQNEKLRMHCETLSAQFRKVVQAEAVKVGKKLQDATEQGFKKADEKFQEVENKRADLEETVGELSQEVSDMKELLLGT